MTRLIWIVALSIALGMATPLAVDYVLFGTITPCHTITQYEDGSSIQSCEVRH